MDHVLIIGGGKDSTLVIEKVHRMGLKTLVADIDREAPGMAMADRTLNLSTHEAQPLLQELRNMSCNGLHVVAVVTRSSGIPVVTAAEIADALDLPGPGVRAARTLTSKLGLSDLCNQFGIQGTGAQPVEIDSPEELIACRFPCVIKPDLESVGKRGVTLVSGPSSIGAAIRRARAASVSGAVIVESYLPGIDLSLLSMVFVGRLYPCFFLKEMNRFDHEGRVECAGFELAEDLDDAKRQAVTRTSQAIATAAGVGCSPFLVSCRVGHDGSPVPVEVNLDFGGEQVLDTLLPSKTDFDFVECFLHSLLSREQPRIPGTL